MNVTITGVDLGIFLSVASFALAWLFWRLSSKEARLIIAQTDEARRILGEIDKKMGEWQQDINKAHVRLIESRPEIIAEKVSMEEAKSSTEAMQRITDIVERLMTEADGESTGYKIVLAKTLLEHQNALVLGRDKIKADIVAGR